MKREVIRVEPITSYLERFKAPASAVTRAGNMVFVSGLPPFDPDTGEIVNAGIERQTEIVMEQMRRCLKAAGASLDNVMKCNIFCTSAKHFAAVNAIYARYFPVDPRARIYVCIPEWTGSFDIEIDCIAIV
ncbi:MAG TPA: RidA family protein [Bradyrhizobium sp.]|jgi:2-iminobutanoate/2-iminopropanoate deaminase|nr:RidA family protein [Bradyrhizobium sp.]